MLINDLDDTVVYQASTVYVRLDTLCRMDNVSTEMLAAHSLVPVNKARMARAGMFPASAPICHHRRTATRLVEDNVPVFHPSSGTACRAAVPIISSQVKTKWNALTSTPALSRPVDRALCALTSPEVRTMSVDVCAHATRPTVTAVSSTGAQDCRLSRAST